MMKKNKILALVLACIVCVGIGIGGTLAWLTAQTGPVTNTFTVGNVDITLAETTTNYKMVPGNTIAKDPKVTVLKDSEACWLFVKIEESTNLDDFISYNVATGWTALAGVSGVYYREVAASTTDQAFDVLANNQVTVKDTVTKTQMDAIKAGTAANPTLTFTAYACQKDNVTTPADAWAKINPPDASGT